MLFDYLSERPKSERKYDKTPYLYFDLGQHLTRILGAPKMTYVHYIPYGTSGVTVKCLGDECPFCKINKQLILEHPNDFRKQKGWNTRQERHHVNVLDRTPVKICPQCAAENKKTAGGTWNPVCKSCSTVIGTVEPTISNKVKVANLSATVAEQLFEYEKTILDENGNHLGLHNFDVMFMVTKPGERKNTVPIPVPTSRDVVEVPEGALHDLSKAVLEVTAEEMLELQKGISLKDIFAARNATDASLAGAVEQEDSLEEDLQDQVKAIEDKMKGIFTDSPSSAPPF